MKILKRLFSVAFAIVLVLFLSGFANKGNISATSISQRSGCGILDFDTGLIYSATLHSVTNHGGNSTLICKGKGLIGTGEERKWRGFECGTFLGPTLDSYLVISASGRATLRCKVKKSKN